MRRRPTTTLEDLELTTARTRPLEETSQVLSLGTVPLHQVAFKAYQVSRNNIWMTLSGSFADREHRKWVEEAVVLPNNPYTTENIVRRWVFLFVVFVCLYFCLFVSFFVGGFVKQSLYNGKYSSQVDHISLAS